MAKRRYAAAAIGKRCLGTCHTGFEYCPGGRWRVVAEDRDSDIEIKGPRRGSRRRAAEAFLRAMADLGDATAAALIAQADTAGRDSRGH